LFIAAAAVLAAGCFGPPRRSAPTWERPFLSVRFDSARDLPVVSNLLGLDTTPSLLEDVVELGGRVTGYRADTLLVEPYYITMYDASRDDRERTLYRGGAYRLPDLAIVESGAGVVVSEFVTPFARKTRALDNILAFGPRILGVLLFLSFLRGIGHW
jgi:hypothetical protein